MSLYFLELPPTEGWKKMISERERIINSTATSMEQESDMLDEYKVLYRLSEDGKSAFLFDLYDEGIEIEGNGIVVPLSSTIVDVRNYYQGTKFVNVIGSTGDTPHLMNGARVSKSWLKVYNQMTKNNNNICYTDHNFYDKNGYYMNKKCNNNPCSYCNNTQNLVGGHIIIGEYNEAFNPITSLMQGYNLDIGILPICNAHNKHNNGFMRLGSQAKVMMINYRIDYVVYKSELEKVRNGLNE